MSSSSTQPPSSGQTTGSPGTHDSNNHNDTLLKNLQSKIPQKAPKVVQPEPTASSSSIIDTIPEDVETLEVNNKGDGDESEGNEKERENDGKEEGGHEHEEVKFDRANGGEEDSSGHEDGEQERKEDDGKEEEQKKKVPLKERIITALPSKGVAISVLKGSLAYTTASILLYSTKFQSLVEVPLSLTGIIIVTIAGFPGKSLGASIQAAVLASIGVLIGSFWFYVLAHLGHAPVGQGFVFAFVVFVAAWVKGKSPKFFGTALLCVLMSFNGIYTSLMPQIGGRFSRGYLISYMSGYLWGAAIVIAVNILVFPHTSERELRESLSLSLEHIRVFCHLIAKTYDLTITPEEKAVRDSLNQNIRADYAMLQSILGETFIEINWSRWSMTDYKEMVARTKEMQQSLLGVYSSLLGVSEKDLVSFKEVFLPRTADHFLSIRRDIHLTIAEMKREMEVGDVQYAQEAEDFKDIEAQQELSRQPSQGSNQKPKEERSTAGMGLGRKITSTFAASNLSRGTVGSSQAEQKARMRAVSDVLAREVGTSNATNTSKAKTRSGSSSGRTSLSGSGAIDEKRNELAEHQESSEAPKKSKAGKTGHKMEKTHSISPYAEDDGNYPDVCRAKKLHLKWIKYAEQTYNTLGDAISQGWFCNPDDPLYVDSAMPSTREMFGEDIVRGKIVEEERKKEEGAKEKTSKTSKKGDPDVKTTALADRAIGRETTSSRKVKRPDTGDGAEQSDFEGDDEGSAPDRKAGEELTEGQRVTKEMKDSQTSILRVYSFLLSMDSFIGQLERMHNVLVRPEPPRKRLHFHFFESITRSHRTDDTLHSHPPAQSQSQSQPIDIEAGTRRTAPAENSEDGGSPIRVETTPAGEIKGRDLSLREALCLLEGIPYQKKKVSFWTRLSRLEAQFRTPDVIYAAKVSAAVIVFGTLYWAPSVRAFFTSYTMTGGLITVVVALSQTLGQSVVVFLFQILGQGFGLIYGTIVSEIFKDVGGFHYNPYGFAAALWLVSVPLAFILYTKPQLFVMPLLAMNSAASYLATLFIYRDRPGFDGPGLRLGKGLATMAVALGIVASFQLLILRNPARRTLRKATASVMYQQMQYNIIFMAYVRAIMPAEASHQPSPVALERVYHDLRKRESRIQADILNLMPLTKFAAAEPAFEKPFEAGHWMAIIRANQIILDRQRDARTALGTKPIENFIIENFIAPLSPFRRRGSRFIRAAYYLNVAALTSKLPLPHELPKTRETLPFMEHDMLVLASRLARRDGGKHISLIKSQEFMRYWCYLVNVLTVGIQLEAVERATKKLFGELEDSNLLPFPMN